MARKGRSGAAEELAGIFQKHLSQFPPEERAKRIAEARKALSDRRGDCSAKPARQSSKSDCLPSHPVHA